MEILPWTVYTRFFLILGLHANIWIRIQIFLDGMSKEWNRIPGIVHVESRD